MKREVTVQVFNSFAEADKANAEAADQMTPAEGILKLLELVKACSAESPGRLSGPYRIITVPKPEPLTSSPDVAG